MNFTEATKERMVSLEKNKRQCWCVNIIRWAWSLRGKGDAGLHPTGRWTWSSQDNRKEGRRETRREPRKEQKARVLCTGWCDSSQPWLPRILLKKILYFQILGIDTFHPDGGCWLKKGLNFKLALKWCKTKVQESLRGWEAQTTANSPLLCHTSLCLSWISRNLGEDISLIQALGFPQME